MPNYKCPKCGRDFDAINMVNGYCYRCDEHYVIADLPEGVTMFREIEVSELAYILHDALDHIYNLARVKVTTEPYKPGETSQGFAVHMYFHEWVYALTEWQVKAYEPIDPFPPIDFKTVGVGRWHVALAWKDNDQLTEWVAMVAVAWVNQLFCEIPVVRQYHEKVLGGRYL